MIWKRKSPADITAGPELRYSGPIEVLLCDDDLSDHHIYIALRCVGDERIRSSHHFLLCWIDSVRYTTLLQQPPHHTFDKERIVAFVNQANPRSHSPVCTDKA